MIDAPSIQTGKAATPLESGNGMPVDPESRVSEIKQRKLESLTWMQENYWDEFSEVWRAVNCRTKPIMVKDKNGNESEDLNRTNVSMPEMNLIVRRKTARLTANPPQLDYYVPGDDETLLSERLTARAYFEYDRSGEAFEIPRGVQQASTFGWSVFKTYYDDVTLDRPTRFKTSNITDKKRMASLLEGQASPDLQDAMNSMPDQLGPQELQYIVAEVGDEIKSTSSLSIYSGPVSKCRFIGDIFIEPGALTLNDSYSVGEQYTETDIWLRKMLRKTYIDPENGNEYPVFDEKAVADLLEQQSKLPQDRTFDLKAKLRDAIQITQPRLEKRLLPNKRFEIYEYHAPDKYGRLWIEYVGNDQIYLGRQPYAFDFGGRTVYGEYVPWPNLIGAIGDSSPRLLRFLHAMHNACVGQRNDLINNILRRTYRATTEADIPDEVIDRSFGRVVIADGAAFSVMDEPDVPAGAWQSEAQITSEMQKAEPIIGGVESGSQFNPQAAKTATTAILAAKSSDVLTNYEINNFNLCLKEMGEKKLEIHRQLADGPIDVPNRKKYVRTEALSERYGKAAVISIDPMELQEIPIEVEPVAGSTLAVDDELRAGKIQTIYQMAEADPVLWNKYAAGKLVLTTLKGVGDTSDLLNDPSEQAPAGPKVNVNVSIPLDKMPADVMNQGLQMVGLEPSQDAVAKQSMEAVGHLSEAANAAANLEAPAKPETPYDKLSKQVDRKVNGSAA